MSKLAEGPQQQDAVVTKDIYTEGQTTIRSEISSKVIDFFDSNQEKPKNFHLEDYIDIIEKEVEKFKQEIAITERIASASVGIYLCFKSDLYKQFLKLGKNDKIIASTLWYLADIKDLDLLKRGYESEIIRDFIERVIICDNECFIDERKVKTNNDMLMFSEGNIIGNVAIESSRSMFARTFLCRVNRWKDKF